MSRRKFDREVTEFRKLREDYRRRGIVMLRADFPTASFRFDALGEKSPIKGVVAVDLDFTNYDLWPPAVAFVDAKSGELLRKAADIPMVRVQGGKPVNMVQQVHRQLPFLCMQGVREYHDNPFHSDDPWLRHRGQGRGTLHYIIDLVQRYAVASPHQPGRLALHGGPRTLAPPVATRGQTP